MPEVRRVVVCVEVGREAHHHVVVQARLRRLLLWGYEDLLGAALGILGLHLRRPPPSAQADTNVQTLQCAYSTSVACS